MKKGFDALAISDHRNKEQVYDNTQYQDKFPEITLLDACEVSRGEHYVLIKEGEKKLKIKAHPGRYRDSVSEVEKWGFYECTEHARLQPKYLQCRGNHPVMSDDAHSLSGVGNAGILVDANTRNGKDILKAIKKGHFRLWASNLKGVVGRRL